LWIRNDGLKLNEKLRRESGAFGCRSVNRLAISFLRSVLRRDYAGQ
jgi:hypothetical protein